MYSNIGHGNIYLFTAFIAAVNYADWVEEIIMKIRTYTDKPILFRPHPAQPKAIELGVEFCRKFNVWIDVTKTLEESLDESSACVTLCSNSSIDALLAGVPTFTFDDNAVAKSITNSKIENINAPLTPLRDLFMKRLAYCQWNIEEISTGKFWDQFLQYFSQIKE